MVCSLPAYLSWLERLFSFRGGGFTPITTAGQHLIAVIVLYFRGPKVPGPEFSCSCCIISDCLIHCTQLSPLCSKCMYGSRLVQVLTLESTAGLIQRFTSPGDLDRLICSSTSLSSLKERCWPSGVTYLSGTVSSLHWAYQTVARTSNSSIGSGTEEVVPARGKKP